MADLGLDQAVNQLTIYYSEMKHQFIAANFKGLSVAEKQEDQQDLSLARLPLPILGHIISYLKTDALDLRLVCRALAADTLKEAYQQAIPLIVPHGFRHENFLRFFHSLLTRKNVQFLNKKLHTTYPLSVNEFKNITAKMPNLEVLGRLKVHNGEAVNTLLENHANQDGQMPWLKSVMICSKKDVVASAYIDADITIDDLLRLLTAAPKIEELFLGKSIIKAADFWQIEASHVPSLTTLHIISEDMYSDGLSGGLGAICGSAPNLKKVFLKSWNEIYSYSAVFPHIEFCRS